MPRVHHFEINGIPTFFCEAPGPTMVGLRFRVGQADETLVGRGHTHLIEHLALTGLDVPYTFNGETGTIVTTFLARGSADECAHFLTHVARSLAALPADRIATEAQVLRAEGRIRGGGGLMGHATSLVHGPRGHGLLGYPEIGLDRADPEVIEDWCSTMFNRDNAALWVVGSAPIGLDLSALRGGVRRPAPPIAPLLDHHPHGSMLPNGGIYVSSVVTRGIATNAMSFVLARRLHDRLRGVEGRSYSVTALLDEWSADQTYLHFRADCLPDAATEVRESFQVEMSRLQMEGPSPAELAEFRGGIDRSIADPVSAVARVGQQALNRLVGRRHMDDEELRRAVGDLEPAAVTEAAQEFAQAPLWLTSNTVDWRDRRILPVPDWSDWETEGPEVEATARNDRGAAERHLVLGPGKVTMRLDQGAAEPKRVSIDLAACAAVIRHSDGGRQLYGCDGFGLSLHPADWERWQQVVTHIDHNAGADVTVVVDRPLRDDVSGAESP